MKWLKRILFALLLLVAIIAIGGYFWLNHSKPTYEGNLKLPGLQEKVDVYFDEVGIPHIYAQNKHDLYLAFGYVHAQDRLFQMEMLRRAGSGRLAEIIGRPLLKVDRMFRSLGVVEYAKKSAQYLESQRGTPMYDDITAYLEGVNSFVQNGETPPEFSIIGIEKTPFTTEDIYYITGAMSFSFSQAQKTEPVVDFIAKNYGKEYLQDMGLWHEAGESYIRSNHASEGNHAQLELESTSQFIGEVKTTSTYQDPSLQMAMAMNELEGILPFAPLEGSNSWVVGGKKTESGEVIFCNDTHIGYLLPQTWYEAHLNAPSFELYGHFMSGVPFALVGRNRELSWGLTMLLNDDMDFYNERVNPQNADEYYYKGNAIKFESIPHVIKIKGENDTTINVRYTAHGPVINDAFEGMAALNPITMYWTYTQKINQTVDAFYGMNNSLSLADFEKNLPLIHAPGLNINYGDKQGNIAWWACASLIKRNPEANSWTYQDGESGVNDPQGFYPFEKNPKCINPEWGYIYSANDWPQAMQVDPMAVNDTMLKSQNEASDTLLWYPGYYKPQYRADRIRKLLEANNKWNVESMKLVMNDHTNSADSQLMSLFYKELLKHPSFQDSAYFRQYDELFHWNGDYDLMSPSPTLFNRMLFHYLHNTMVDEIGEERFKLFLQTHQIQRTQLLLFQKEASPWWDIKGTIQLETRRDLIYKAFCMSVDELSDQLGKNPKVWNWRKVTTLELKHPLGEVALFRPLFNVGPEPVNGGNETILQSGFKMDSTIQNKVFFGSQMRIILDFADAANGVNITPCGQSGHLMSKHYRDQAERYREMKFREMLMDRSQVEKMDHLTFEP
jgi:penicillin amidase